MNNKVHLLSEGAKVTELWGRVTPARFNDYEVHVTASRASTSGTLTRIPTTS